MLKLTSDFFDGMFTIPKANPDPDDLSRDGLTVLPMAEPNNVLYLSLSMRRLRNTSSSAC
jgi:hypothetical protein